MSGVDFHAFSLVAGRKAHRCEQCGKLTSIGERHRKCAHVWEGQFASYREHVECYEAWNELNFSPEARDLSPYEGALFLRDDEHDESDKEWMREKYPLVADRLGWSANP